MCVCVCVCVLFLTGKIGSQVVIPYRGCELDYRHLKVMGDLGQIVPVFYSSKNTQEIEKLVENSNVVFNLIGRDYETKNFSFEDVHVKVLPLSSVHNLNETTN